MKNTHTQTKQKATIMEQLTNLISEKTGLSDATATHVAEITVSFIKEKLPESCAEQVDVFFSNEPAIDTPGSLADTAKALFG